MDANTRLQRWQAGSGARRGGEPGHDRWWRRHPLSLGRGPLGAARPRSPRARRQIVTTATASGPWDSNLIA